MNIRRTITRLEDIIQYSEQEFLTVGEALHMVDLQIIDIGNDADYLKEIIQDHVFENRRQKLDDLLYGHGAELTSAQDIEESLARMSDLLIEDQANLQKMINQIKGMQKTDLVVRVELSHHDDLAESYSNLAGQVSSLASEIKGRSQFLLSSSLKMSGMVHGSTTILHNLFHSIGRLSSRLIENVHSRLQLMRGKHGQSKNLAESLSEERTSLRDHLDIMVSKLQMHDIIRQKIQGVVSLLRSHSPDIPPTAMLQDSIESLKKTNDNFIETIEEIRLQLISINSRLTALQQGCIRLTSSIAASSRTGLHISEHHNLIHMDDLVMISRECMKSESNLKKFIDSVSEGATDDRQTLQEIISLGSDIELFSQNAAVTAGNAEEISSSLIIMAEQTQRDIAALRNVLARILTTKERIETESDQLYSLYQANKNELEEMIEFMAELDEQIVPMEQIQKKTSDRIEKLSDHLEKIISTISKLIDTFHSDHYNSSAILEAIHLLDADQSSPSPKNRIQEYAPNTHRNEIEAMTQKKLVGTQNHNSPQETDNPENEFGGDVEFF